MQVSGINTLQCKIVSKKGKKIVSHENVNFSVKYHIVTKAEMYKWNIFLCVFS